MEELSTTGCMILTGVLARPGWRFFGSRGLGESLLSNQDTPPKVNTTASDDSNLVRHIESVVVFRQASTDGHNTVVLSLSWTRI